MIVRKYLTAAAALVSALVLVTSARAETDAELIARARGIHERVLTVDTHVDIPPDYGSAAYDPMKPGPRGQQVHLPTQFEGGLDATFLIVFVGQGELSTQGYAKALSDAMLKFSAINKVTSQMYPDKVELARTAADARRISTAGKKVAFIGVENGYPIGEEIGLLDVFYDYGARYFGHTHIGHNQLGDSSMNLGRDVAKPVEPKHVGLSAIGKEAVKRCNELGIMNDVSHAGKQTALDIAKLSKAPVIASHSGVKGVFDHPRNLSDEELLAIKKSNGVAQMVAFDTYLRAVPKAKTEATNALWAEMGIKDFPDLGKLSPEQLKTYRAKADEIELKYPRAGVKDLADHIDYTVKLIGIDHVGIASDFNGGGGIVGWNSASETFNVTLELVKRGYTDEQIEKIWGGNLLRVLADVEKYAAKTKYNKKRGRA
ncbi:MAG: membrane dipeptidase [Rhodospirillaceae bacterium]|nr:membrane dipeptidase [Rhodospirillaceae bacterium]